MGYVESLMGKDERVLHVTRHHWTALVGRTWPLLLLLVVGVALAVGGNLFGGSLLAGLGLTNTQELAVRAGVVVLLVAYPVVALVLRYVRWRGDQFIVTNFRVVHVAGLLAKSVIDSSLEKVNDVTLYQSLIGRLFDFGDVEILTGSEIGVNKLARIAHPLEFKKAMLDAKQELEEPDESSQLAVPQLLSQLADLRDRGAITEEEFQAEKAQLLHRG